MKPLNRVERSNAFLHFLLFFLLTISVIIAVAFFSIDVPFRQAEQLREQMSVMESRNNFSDSFAYAMKEAVNELHKYDVKDDVNVPAAAIRQRVEFKISKMNNLIGDVPQSDTSIYALVVQSLRDLNEAKTKIKRLEDEKSYARQ